MTDLLTDDFVRAASDRLFTWLSRDALPLWSTTGVDQHHGGFIERLSPDGQLISDVRRARLVARQIFAFKAAGDLGWSGPVDSLVRHGLAALVDHHLTAENEVVPCYVPADNTGEGDFDLYDQAFVLFGLAHAYAHTKEDQLEARALSILQRMREHWAQGYGGFVEHQPPQAPLKANPHMHLLEAGLAWTAVSASSAWRCLAKEIVELCITRFIDPRTGSLHEYFQTDWTFREEGEDVVEPGHQAEWAWLLLKWQAVEPTDGLEYVAKRLLEVAEEHGLDARQHRLINELNRDLSARDRRLRLWPQTERIKALVAFRESRVDAMPLDDLERRLGQAIDALQGYFKHPIAGSWWEHFDRDGDPLAEPARASSLYHIMGAAVELARQTGARLE